MFKKMPRQKIYLFLFLTLYHIVFTTLGSTTDALRTSLDDQKIVKSQSHPSQIDGLNESRPGVDPSQEFSSQTSHQNSSQDSFLSLNDSQDFLSSTENLTEEMIAEPYEVLTQTSSPVSSQSPEHFYEQGKKYYHQKRFEEAFNNFYDASQEKHIKAHYILGHMYSHGHGTAFDLDEAYKCFRYAMNQGHRDAGLAKKQLDLKYSHPHQTTFQQDLQSPDVEPASPEITSDVRSGPDSDNGMRKKRKRLSKEVLKTIDPFEVLTQAPPILPLSQEILTPPFMTSFEQLKDNYEVFLFDIVGVIHDGKTPYRNFIEMLNELAKTKIVICVSNTPRPHDCPAKVLAEMGLDPQIPVFTAGDLVRDDLVETYKNQKIYHLGADCNEDILRDLEVQTTPTFEHSDLVLLTKFVDSKDALDDFHDILKNIATEKKLVLCANADKTARVGDGLRYCAGTFAEIIENAGGLVLYYGKPNIEIFEKMAEKIPEIKTISKDKILFSGDTFEKDVRGAHNYGIHSLLFLDPGSQESSQDLKIKLKTSCRTEKIKPTYYTKHCNL